MPSNNIANKDFLEQLVRKVIKEQDDDVSYPQEEEIEFGEQDDGAGGAQGAPGSAEGDGEGGSEDDAGDNSQGAGGAGGAGTNQDKDEDKPAQLDALEGGDAAAVGEKVPNVTETGFFDDFWSALWANYKNSAVNFRKNLFYNGSGILQAIGDWEVGNSYEKQSIKTFLSVFANTDASKRGKLSYGALGQGTGKGEAGQVFIWQDPEYYRFRPAVANAMKKFISYGTGSPKKGRQKFWKELIKEMQRAEKSGPRRTLGIGPTMNYFWQKQWNRFQAEVNTVYLIGFEGSNSGILATHHPTGIEGISATDTDGKNLRAKMNNQQKAKIIGKNLGLHEDEMLEYFSIVKRYYLKKEKTRRNRTELGNIFRDGWSIALGIEDKELDKELNSWIGGVRQHHNDPKDAGPDLRRHWINVITGKHAAYLRGQHNGDRGDVKTPADRDYYAWHEFVAETIGGTLSMQDERVKVAFGRRPKPNVHGKWLTPIKYDKFGHLTYRRDISKAKRDGVPPKVGSLYEEIMMHLFPPKRGPVTRRMRDRRRRKNERLINAGQQPDNSPLVGKLSKYYDTKGLQPYEVEIKINKLIVELAQEITKKRWFKKLEDEKKKGFTGDAEKRYKGSVRARRSAYKYDRTPDWWTWTHEWDEATRKQGSPRSTWGKALKHLTIDTPKFYSDLFKEELEKFYEELKINEGGTPVILRPNNYGDYEGLRKRFNQNNIQISDLFASWNFSTEVTTSQGPKRQVFNNLMRSMSFSFTEKARSIDVKKQESFPDWCPLDCFVLLFNGVLENYHSSAVLSSMLDEGQKIHNPLENCEKKFEVKDESKTHGRWANNYEDAKDMQPSMIRDCKKFASKSMDIRTASNTFNFENILNQYQEVWESTGRKGDPNFLLQVAKDHSRLGTEKWFEKYHKKPFVQRLLSDKLLLTEWLTITLIGSFGGGENTYLGRPRAFWSELAKHQTDTAEMGEYFAAANLLSILLLSVVFDADGPLFVLAGKGMASIAGAATGATLGAGAVAAITVGLVVVYCIMVHFNVGGWFNYTDNIDSLMGELEGLLSEIDDLVRPLDISTVPNPDRKREVIEQVQQTNKEILKLLEAFKAKAKKIVNFMDEIIRSSVRKSLHFKQFAPAELMTYVRSTSDYITQINDMLQKPFDLQEQEGQFVVSQAEINDAIINFTSLKSKLLEYLAKLESMGDDKASLAIDERSTPFYDSLLFEKAQLIVEQDKSGNQQDKKDEYDGTGKDDATMAQKYRELIAKTDTDQAKAQGAPKLIQRTGEKSKGTDKLSLNTRPDSSEKEAPKATVDKGDKGKEKKIVYSDNADRLGDQLLDKIMNFHRLIEFRKSRGKKVANMKRAEEENKRLLSKLLKTTNLLNNFDPKISASTSRWTVNFIKNVGRQLPDIRNQISDSRNKKIDELYKIHDQYLVKIGFPRRRPNESYAELLEKIAPELLNAETSLHKDLMNDKKVSPDVRGRWFDLVGDQSNESIINTYTRSKKGQNLLVLSDDYLKTSTSMSNVYNFTRSGLVTARSSEAPIVATSVYALGNPLAPDINSLGAKADTSGGQNTKFKPTQSFYRYSFPESQPTSKLLSDSNYNKFENIVDNLIKRFTPAREGPKTLKLKKENVENYAISPDGKGVHPIEVLYQYADNVRFVDMEVTRLQAMLKKVTSDTDISKAAGVPTTTTGGAGANARGPVAQATSPIVTGQIMKPSEAEAAHRIEILQIHKKFISALVNALNQILVADKKVIEIAEEKGGIFGVSDAEKKTAALSTLRSSREKIKDLGQGFAVMKKGSGNKLIEDKTNKLVYKRTVEKIFQVSESKWYFEFDADIVQNEKKGVKYMIWRSAGQMDRSKLQTAGIPKSKIPEPKDLPKGDAAKDLPVQIYNKYFAGLADTVWELKGENSKMIGIVGKYDNKQVLFPASLIQAKNKKLSLNVDGADLKKVEFKYSSMDMPPKKLPEQFALEGIKENLQIGSPQGDLLIEQQIEESTKKWSESRKKAVKLFAIKNSCLEALYRLDRLLLEEDVRMYTFTKYFLNV